MIKIAKQIIKTIGLVNNGELNLHHTFYALQGRRFVIGYPESDVVLEADVLRGLSVGRVGSKGDIAVRREVSPREFSTLLNEVVKATRR